MSTYHTPTRRAVLAAASVGVAATIAAPTNPVAAAPTTFVVDTLSDNSADGLTLRDAIDDANTNAGADRIEFASGLTGTIFLTSGQLESTDDLTIDGPDDEAIIIDGGGSSRVLTSSTAATQLHLFDLTIANGATLGSGGGVAYSAGDDLFVRNVDFVGNEASGQGGGLWIANPSSADFSLMGVSFESNRSGDSGGGLFIGDPVGAGALDLVSMTFVDNTSVNGDGGGLFLSTPSRSVDATAIEVIGNRATNGDAGGAWVEADEISVFGGEIANNVAGGLYGGVALNASGTNLLVRDTVITANSAGHGAGIVSAANDVVLVDVTVADHDSPETGGLLASAGTDIMIRRSTFDRNSGGVVGGLRAVGADSLTLDDSTFEANSGDGIGGLAATGIASVKIGSSTFSNNVADAVAGIGGAVRVGGTDLRVFESTFVGNEAAEGAAIYASGFSTVRLSHATVVDNVASDEAGGVYVSVTGNIAIVDSIVSNNSAPTFPDVNDATPEIAYTILGNETGLAINGSSNIIGEDPLLGPLTDNGGPTETMLPRISSPAIDAADPGPALVSTDQRGRLRVAGRRDLGSVEVFDGENQVWVPTTPSRFVDTRSFGETMDDSHEATGAFSAGEQRTIAFAGRGGVPANAVAVIANITAVNPSSNGFVTAHQCVVPRPNIASLNYTSGVNLGNEIILGLTDHGEACIFTSSGADITVDVVGYIGSKSRYTRVEPTRMADTRPDGVTFDGMSKGGGAPGAGAQFEVKINGRLPLTPGATSAVLYVAAVNPASSGFVTAWGCGTEQPLASSLNHVAGVNRGSEIVVDLGSDGSVCFFTSAEVDLTVDAIGYIRSGSNYESLDSPSRFLDTRATGETIDDIAEGDGALDASETFELQVTGRAGIPDIATTVALNVTAIAPSAPGFITVFDCETQPLASSLNYVPGVNGGNEIIAELNADGRICLFTSTATHLAADLTGFTSL